MNIKLCSHFKTGMTNLTDGSCPYCEMDDLLVDLKKAQNDIEISIKRLKNKYQSKPLSEAEYRTEITGLSQIHPLAAKLPNGEIASNVYQAYDIGYEQGVKFRAGKHRAWIGPNGAFTQDKKRMEKWERKGFPFITLLSDARYDL